MALKMNYFLLPIGTMFVSVVIGQNGPLEELLLSNYFCLSGFIWFSMPMQWLDSGPDVQPVHLGFKSQGQLGHYQCSSLYTF